MRAEDMPAAAWERFQALQQHYLANLPARWQQVSQAQPGTLRDGLHRLVGSAGAFGFGRLSDLAREAERLLLTGEPGELASALQLLEREVFALTQPSAQGSDG